MPLVRKLPDSLAGIHFGRVADSLLRIDWVSVPWLIIASGTVHGLTCDDLAAHALRQGRNVLREAIDRTQEVRLVTRVEIGREGAEVGWEGGVLDALAADACAQPRTRSTAEQRADGSIATHRCGST